MLKIFLRKHALVPGRFYTVDRLCTGSCKILHGGNIKLHHLRDIELLCQGGRAAISGVVPIPAELRVDLQLLVYSLAVQLVGHVHRFTAGLDRTDYVHFTLQRLMDVFLVVCQMHPDRRVSDSHIHLHFGLCSHALRRI